MIAQYINKLSKENKTGSATEHTYRGHLKVSDNTKKDNEGDF